MTIEELENIFENCGTNPTRWPANRKAEIERLIALDQQAMKLEQEFRNLEKSLNQLYVPDFSELEQVVLNQNLPPRTDSFFEKFLNWLFPAGNNFKNLWRPAAAACIPLIFGATLGNNFAFGIDISLEENEYWEDQLIILALYDYSEEFFYD